MSIFCGWCVSTEPATPGIYTYRHTLALHGALPFFTNTRSSARISSAIASRSASRTVVRTSSAPSASCGSAADDVASLAAASVWAADSALAGFAGRSEEHTSELQSLMRISYAVVCLQKKKQTITYHHNLKKHS